MTSKSTNLIASAQLKSGAGSIKGFFVNSTTSGTIKIWDSLTASGKVIINTATLPVGYYDLFDASFDIGCYITIGATLDVTIFWE